MAGSILDKVPRRGTLTEAPRPSAGPETMASPWAQVAGMFGAASGLVLDAAEANATERGANAVTRDEEGNLGVRLMSNLTTIGRNYNRAASSAYLARLSGDMRTAASDFTRDSNGNPEAFSAAWSGYAENILGKVPPRLRGGVQAMLEDVGGTTSRGIQDARFEADMSEFADAIETERERRRNDLLRMAELGLTGTPEFQRAVAEYRDLGQEVAGNPAFAVSAEAQTYADDRFAAQLRIEYARGEVARRFASSPLEARAWAEEYLAAEDLELTPEERRDAVAGIMQQFTASSSEYNLRRQAVRDQYAGLKTALQSDAMPIDPTEVAAAITAFEAVQDYAGAAEIRMLVNTRQQLDAFRAADQATQLGIFDANTAAAAGLAEPAAVAFLSERGGSNLDWRNVSTGMASSIMRAAQDFEAANPGQRAGFTSAARSAEQQAQLYANYTQQPVVWEGVTYRPNVPPGYQGLAAPPGSSRHQTGNAVDLADGAFLAWMQEPGRAASYGLEFLSGEAGRVDPGHIQLIGGASGGGAGVVPPAVWQGQREVMTDELRVMLDQYDTVIGGGYGIGEEEANILVGFARAADDPALTSRVQTIITESMTNALVNPLNARTAEQLLVELNAAGNNGEGYVAAIMQTQAEAIERNKDELRQNNPAMLGQVQGLYELSPMPSNVADLPGAIETRATQLAQLSAAEGVAYQRLLQPEEAAQFAEAFRTADVNGRTAMVTAFAGAIDDIDVLNATLGQFMEEGATGLAMAGAIAAVNPAMAEAVVRGQALLQINGAWAVDREDAADGTLGLEGYAAEHIPFGAFAGNGLLEGARQSLIEAAHYAYVGLAAAAGVEPGDAVVPELMQQAFDGVTGGTVTFNGQPVISPVYGMSQDEFDRAWMRVASPVPGAGLWEPLRATPAPIEIALRGAQTAEGVPIMWEDVWRSSDVFLESTGDGRYAIRFGTGPGAGYAMQADGTLFELDMKRALAIYAMDGPEAPSIWQQAAERAPAQATVTRAEPEMGLGPQVLPTPRNPPAGGDGLVARDFPMPSAPRPGLLEGFGETGPAPAEPQAFEQRMERDLASREALNITPGAPEWDEAQAILATASPRNPEELTRENFYALMIVSNRPRGELLRMMATQWGTSVMLLNQKLGLPGL